MLESLTRARSFAIAAHGDQTYGDEPYVFHLDAVVELLAPFGLDARDPAFWQGGLGVIERMIEELEALG